MMLDLSMLGAMCGRHMHSAAANMENLASVLLCMLQQDVPEMKMIVLHAWLSARLSLMLRKCLPALHFSS